jgi:hypothetical protein
MKTAAKLPSLSWLAVLAVAFLSVFAPSSARALDLGVSTYIERFSMVSSTTYRWTVFGVSHNLRYTSFGTAQGPWEIEPINGLDVIQLQVWNALRSANGTGDYRRSAEVFPVGPTDYVLVARKVVPTPYVPPPDAVPDMGVVVMERIDIEGPWIDGLTYHASGLPRGVSCDRATGDIFGYPEKTGIYTVRRWNQRGKAKSEVRSSTLTVSPLPPALTGRYEALLRLDDSEPLAHVSLQVAANGAYSGRLLRVGRAARPFKGWFGYEMRSVDVQYNPAAPRLQGTAEFDTTLRHVSDLSLSFRYDATGGFQVDSAYKVKEDLIAFLFNPGVKLADFTAAQPAPWGGKTYVLALRAEGAPASAPAGAGAVSVSAAASGALTFRGKTADGATVTGAFGPTADARFRPFLLPAGQPGAYLAGDLRLRPSAGLYYAGAADADLRWRKPALANATYPSGFGPLRVTPRLTPWTRPTAAALAASLGLGAPASLDLVITAPGVSNLGGNPLGLPVGLLLDTKGRLLGDGADASRFSTKLDLKTGIVTGHILGGTPESPATARKHTFRAVLFQSAALASPATVAEGFALVPSAPAAQARSAYFRLLYVP